MDDAPPPYTPIDLSQLTRSVSAPATTHPSQPAPSEPAPSKAAAQYTPAQPPPHTRTPSPPLPPHPPQNASRRQRRRTSSGGTSESGSQSKKPAEPFEWTLCNTICLIIVAPPIFVFAFPYFVFRELLPKREKTKSDDSTPEAQEKRRGRKQSV